MPNPSVKARCTAADIDEDTAREGGIKISYTLWVFRILWIKFTVPVSQKPALLKFALNPSLLHSYLVSLKEEHSKPTADTSRRKWCDLKALAVSRRGDYPVQVSGDGEAGCSPLLRKAPLYTPFRSAMLIMARTAGLHSRKW